MLVLIGLPVITKRMAPHRHPPPCRSNMAQSMKSADEGVKLPDHLKAKFPVKMTVILQYQFERLT